MSSRSSGPPRPVLVAHCLMLLAVAIAVLGAATAHAADYKLLLCAGNNGSNSFQTATNTADPQHPSGIFNFENYCGPAPDPAGSSAFLQIAENQPSGNAGEGAYGQVSWTVPPWVSILAGGGYTREPASFNEGWRGRFWAEGFDGSTNNILMQGAGVTNGSLGGIGWADCNAFCSHLWPFGSYGNFRRFVFEMTCVRPAGCDRSGVNEVDANTFTLILSDTSPPQVGFTNAGSPLLSGQWVRGNQEASWSSSDQGSGLRFERLRVDGSLLKENDLRGQCDLDSSQASGEFARSFTPCPGGPIGSSYVLNTAGLPDGVHTLQVCAQDYAQAADLSSVHGESCQQRTIRTDNTPPGSPTGLEVTSANPARYLPHFGAQFSLPPNQSSPITKVHYQAINAAGEVVVPEQTYSATNPTEVPQIEGPKAPGDYRLRVWLQDEVGFEGPPSTAPIPHDTTPPAAPQGLSVTAPGVSRATEGFDLRWHNILDNGSPIDAAHYQVLDSAGNVVVPTQTVSGDGIDSIADLETPSGAGSYTLRLWLSDEEGNVGSAVLAPLAYDCPRSAVVGGTQLSAGFNGASSQTVQQGAGSILGGTLQGAGGGVSGAPLCVFSQVLTDPGREFLGIAISGPGGGYRFPVPAGASRELTVVYRPDNRELSTTATLQTVVHPTLNAVRRVVRNREVARFYGEIPGPHNDEVTVVLQVKEGREWLAFRRYRTRGGGHFRLGYFFHRTYKPTTYEMRAQVRQTVGYPYLQGDSPLLYLRVLPDRSSLRARRRSAHNG